MLYPWVNLKYKNTCFVLKLLIATASVQFLPQHSYTHTTMKISQSLALELLAQGNSPFLELFKHGTLSLEIYQPDQVDHQIPHDRDEVYVVVSGSGQFFCNGNTMPFAAGDFLFVPAFVEHRFLDFTPDFATWVLFYGPKGGEAKNTTTAKKIW
jgi:hypothetical protein